MYCTLASHLYDSPPKALSSTLYGILCRAIAILHIIHQPSLSHFHPCLSFLLVLAIPIGAKARLIDGPTNRAQVLRVRSSKVGSQHSKNSRSRPERRELGLDILLRLVGVVGVLEGARCSDGSVTSINYIHSLEPTVQDECGKKGKERKGKERKGNEEKASTYPLSPAIWRLISFPSSATSAF